MKDATTKMEKLLEMLKGVDEKIANLNAKIQRFHDAFMDAGEFTHRHLAGLQEIREEIVEEMDKNFVHINR